MWTRYETRVNLTSECVVHRDKYREEQAVRQTVTVTMERNAPQTVASCSDDDVDDSEWLRSSPSSTTTIATLSLSASATQGDGGGDPGTERQQHQYPQIETR